MRINKNPERASSLARSGKAPQILIVDDEKMLADLLAQALSVQGWDTFTANDGFQAVQEARKHCPDAIVMDVMMPVWMVLKPWRESVKTVQISRY